MSGAATSGRPCSTKGCTETVFPWTTFCWGCEAYITDEGAGAARKDPGDKEDRAASVSVPDPVLLIFPWDVLANVNDRVAPVGKEGKSRHARYRTHRDSMAAIVAQKMNGRRPFEGPVRVTMEFYPPDEREDPSNFEKALLDALQGPEGLPGVYPNDRQARHRVSVDYAPVSENPRLEVRVEAIMMEGAA